MLGCAMMEARQECTIEQFVPGALLFLTLQCRGCSEGEIEMLAGTPLEIHTDAHVSYGDPRVTLLFRRLQSLIRLFI